jgi:hypothetical protein
MHKAKRVKNDEFYTLMPDIENEIQHYLPHFRGKVVYCNCDTTDSNFYKYFTDNFDALGLKGLLRSNYDATTGSGDFRSQESIDLLKQADIVVTNPPFSLFREFVSQLFGYDKKFLIVGNMNAVTYKDVFKYIKENRLWLGTTGRIKKFIVPINTYLKLEYEHEVGYELILISKGLLCQ